MRKSAGRQLGRGGGGAIGSPDHAGPAGRSYAAGGEEGRAGAAAVRGAAWGAFRFDSSGTSGRLPALSPAGAGRGRNTLELSAAVPARTAGLWPYSRPMSNNRVLRARFRVNALELRGAAATAPMSQVISVHFHLGQLCS